MKRFEYKTFDNDQRKFDCIELIPFLNNLGNDGWELVHYHMHANGIQSFLMKREKQIENEG